MRVRLARSLPWKYQLAVTCALEHFTAILADALLGDRRLVAGMHPAMASLWRWHAIEETEHKAVAFDVYRTVAPGFGGYLRRIFAMLIVTVLFTSQIVLHQAWLELHEGVFWRLRARAHAFRYFWTEPGFLRQALRSYLAYFRLSFHPWDHDNSKLVAEWKAEYANGQGIAGFA
jgi:predicted metal-dependent hydrolase